MELTKLAYRTIPRYLYRVWLWETGRQLATPGRIFTNRKEAEQHARNNRPAEVVQYAVEPTQEIPRRFE